MKIIAILVMPLLKCSVWHYHFFCVNLKYILVSHLVPLFPSHSKLCCWHWNAPCSSDFYNLCLIWLLIHYYTLKIVGYFLSGFVFSYTHPVHVKSTVDLWWTNYNVSFLLHSPCSSCQAVTECLAAAWCTVGVSQETFAMASFCL